MKKRRTLLFVLTIVCVMLYSVFLAKNTQSFIQSIPEFGRYFSFSSYEELDSYGYGESNGGNKIYQVKNHFSGEKYWVVINASTIEKSLSFYQRMIDIKTKKIESEPKYAARGKASIDRFKKLKSNLTKLSNMPIVRAIITYPEDSLKPVGFDNNPLEYPYDQAIYYVDEMPETIFASLKDEYEYYSKRDGKVLLFVPQKLDSKEIGYLKEETLNELKRMF